MNLNNFENVTHSAQGETVFLGGWLAWLAWLAWLTPWLAWLAWLALWLAWLAGSHISKTRLQLPQLKHVPHGRKMQRPKHDLPSRSHDNNLKRDIHWSLRYNLHYIYIYIERERETLTMHTPTNHISRVNVWKKVCPERDLNVLSWLRSCIINLILSWVSSGVLGSPTLSPWKKSFPGGPRLDHVNHLFDGCVASMVVLVV